MQLEQLPLSPLRTHTHFVEDLLSTMAERVPNEMLSYNEIPAGWRIQPEDEAFSQAGLVVWTPASPTAALSLDDQRALTLRRLHEHPGRLRRDQQVARNSDLCEPRRWRATALYNELYRPLHIENQCLLYLPAPPGMELVLAYNRERGDFSDAELAELGAAQRGLTPIIRDHWRYLELLAEQARWRALAESEGRGVIHLDERGRPRWVSPRARALLREHGLALEGQRLPAPLRRWLAPLHHARQRTLPAFRCCARDQLLDVSLHPGDSGGVLVLEARAVAKDPATAVQAHTRSLAEALDLTPRQAEVALWLRYGKSNADIAALLSIRPATVKKHLERVFDKLGVENRTSAASRVLEVLEVLESGSTAPAQRNIH
ncbi:helix-turn-helix transcriptional regulator [Pseudenhygromyxa sp. WMMC2535]|uniref:helix-turn-helix transcriptional regulator n=1 Tax=Pseudenhygromyxa sp. WMMC2535 TaxID=2712867 RepID=UPI001595F44C|nr:helix-turn-helix transcriptional regulator [Pseudenhygromyxa sp. WMMC2535]NVB39435.1 helix-turn-helix transcriptional regulator [Pseudenhygromyxa sp. WMMC2535]